MCPASAHTCSCSPARSRPTGRGTAVVSPRRRACVLRGSCVRRKPGHSVVWPRTVTSAFARAASASVAAGKLKTVSGERTGGYTLVGATQCLGSAITPGSAAPLLGVAFSPLPRPVPYVLQLVRIAVNRYRNVQIQKTKALGIASLGREAQPPPARPLRPGPCPPLTPSPRARPAARTGGRGPRPTRSRPPAAAPGLPLLSTVRVPVNHSTTEQAHTPQHTPLRC